MLLPVESTEEGTGKDPVLTLGQVAGENLRRMRVARGLTQDELSRLLGTSGLMWQRSHIAALENGNRETIDLGVLWLLAIVVKVPIIRFFEGEGDIRLTPNAIVSRENFRKLIPPPEKGPNVSITLGSRAFRLFWDSIDGETISFQADAELAQRLGLRPEDVYLTAERLWGRNLHQEREKRVAELGELSPGQRRAKRGHITRQLTKELQPHLPKSEEE